MSNSDDSGQGPADSPPIPQKLERYVELARSKRQGERTAVAVQAFYEEVRQTFAHAWAFELTKIYLECLATAQDELPKGD